MPAYRLHRQSGFTFLEILVGTIILMIGIASIIALVLWGRLVLKQSENKAAAMNVAFSKMEEYLAKSYSRIGTRQGASPDAIEASINVIPRPQGEEGQIFSERGPDRESNIDWEVNVYQDYEGNDEKFPSPKDVPAGHVVVTIPYKRIEVIARYQEESPGQQRGIFHQRAVRLVSIVPYPVLHAISKEVGANSALVVPASNNYNGPNSTVLEMDLGALKPRENPSDPPVSLAYETPKEILIIYNIAIKIDDFKDLIDDNPGLYTIFTSCFLDNETEPMPVETRTPILSQPLISNVTALTGARALKVQSGKYKLRLKWRKDPNAKGKISLRSANIIVIAFEEQKS
ncbi:MAG: type II secretion system protein [Candidatus Omnitrophica bacterium]|nr:type II secretion system protein [Candidatus Omnitrophota bacterium]